MVSKKALYFAIGILFVISILFLLSDIKAQKLFYEDVAAEEIQIQLKRKSEQHSLETLTKEDLQLFFEAWGALDEHYVPPPPSPEDEEDETDDSEEEITEGRRHMINAIRGLLTTARDPYTTFLPKKKLDKFSSEVIDGQITGIGIYIGSRNDLPIVLAPLPGSPAKKAGLRSNDIILEVDDVDVSEKSIDDIVKLIRGVRGTTVDLKIFRLSAQQEKVVSIERQHINIPSVIHNNIKDVFYIRLTGFSRNTPGDFKEALDYAKKNRYRKFIIDMRNNPGGVLDVAQHIAGFFTPKGKPVFYEYDGTEHVRGFTSKAEQIEGIEDIDIVVIINEGTASASEILTGVLRFYTNAIVVGTRSHGKGSVQRIFDLSDGSAVKITHAHWLLPDKTGISNNGIAPDVFVTEEEITEYEELLEELSDDRDYHLLPFSDIDMRDPFINKALREL